MPEVLDKTGWYVCAALGKSKLARMYYLAGGTALALQISHRKSYDLDFFRIGVHERINFNAIAGELKKLFREEDINVVLRKADQTIIEVRGTKITFLAYPFPLLEMLIPGKQISVELSGLKLASPPEIALMKAYAIGRRTTFRDYLDLYALLKKGLVTLDYILEKGPKKFVIAGENIFSPKLFLEQLVYTKDIEDKEAAIATLCEERISSDQIEEFFRRQVKRVLEEHVTDQRGIER